MNTTLLAQSRTPLRPVELVRDSTEAAVTAPGPGAGAWMWGCVAVLVVVVAVVAIRRLVHTRSADQGVAAFRVLARRLGLTKAERDLVAALAGHAGGRAVHPVALLLSRDAFARCADSAVRARATWAPPEEMGELHAKIFRV